MNHERARTRQVPAWPEPGGASSGYLITSGDTRLLVDCGHGVAGKLREACDIQDLDAVYLSHLHMDHNADLTALAYALKYMPHPRQGVRPLLVLAPGARETLRTIAATWDAPGLFEDAFQVVTHHPGRPVTVGELELKTAAVPHAVLTHAVDITSRAGRRVTFGADCGPNRALVELAAGSDLLIAEATWPDTDPYGIHLCAREAGEHARDAHAGALMLTHYPDAYQPEQLHYDARVAYPGRVLLAAGGLSVDV